MSFPLTILAAYFYPQATLSSVSFSSTQVEAGQVKLSLSTTAMNLWVSAMRTKHTGRMDVLGSSGYSYITSLSIFSLHSNSGRLHTNTRRYQEGDLSTPYGSAEWFLKAWQLCSIWGRHKYGSYLCRCSGRRHSLGMPLTKLIEYAVILALETWVGNPVRCLDDYIQSQEISCNQCVNCGLQKLLGILLQGRAEPDFEARYLSKAHISSTPLILGCFDR